MDLAAQFLDRHKEKAIASLKTRVLGVFRAVSSAGRGKRELLGLDDSFGKARHRLGFIKKYPGVRNENNASRIDSISLVFGSSLSKHLAWHGPGSAW